MTIAQLHIMTSYSLLKSTIRIEEVVQKAKTEGYSALAITDLNVMHGAIEFYESCKKAGIHPIIGLTLEYSGSEESTEKSHVLLLAKNIQGYQNLMEISTKKMKEQENQRDRLETYAPFLNDLFVVLPEKESEIGSLHRENQEQADLRMRQLKEWVEPHSLFAGITFKGQNQASWLEFCGTHDIPLVALQEVRYLNPEDDFSYQVIRNIELGTKISLEKQPLRGPLYLPSIEEMDAFYAESSLLNALKNTGYIAKQCQVDIPLHQTLLPHYEVPNGESAGSYLRRLCHEKMTDKIEHISDVYIERLEMELAVIHEMGFDDYFLIVWDVMDFAHRKKIVTGAGRGSAAGSLVSYVLSITEVDPIAYNLLFERFLNKERYTMPDIDLDIPDNRREEVLQYVLETYGRNHVAQIATFGTMAAKMALRDVARVFGLSQSEATLWSKAIPNKLKISLKQAYEESKSLKKLVAESPRNQRLFETAVKLEGLPRHVSTHAAGVVISDENLTHLVPLQEGSNGILLTQFTMGDVERIGLLKMDFLGLRNLSIMDDALRHILRIYKKEVHLGKIPLDDQETLSLFQRGETTGVFQFESSGIRNVLRRLGPTSIEDISAVNALYRPGPMDNITTFINRKKGLEAVSYPEESLKPILEVTYGIIVYQEQIMQVASKMAGYSLGQADILRRAISKKKKEILDEQRANFVRGSKEKGYSEDSANQVYDYIERFANYGFNRSHAVAYSFIGYQMAYLKVHYPAPFFAALLHSVSHNAGKVREYCAEAKKFGIEIKGLDINKSEYSFYLSKAKILFGLSIVKGIRRDFIKDILSERKQNGFYKSLEDFLMRMDKKWLKQDYLVPLIMVGAFDSLQSNRKQLVTDLNGLLENIVLTGGSASLLDMLSLKKEQTVDYTVAEKLAKEEEYAGMYLSGHPVEEYKTLAGLYDAVTTKQLEVGAKSYLFVYSKSIRVIRTKKGEAMAFLTGSDVSGEISLTIFPRLYRAIRSQLKENEVYLVCGKVEKSNYNQEIQLLVEEITEAQVLQKQLAEKKCYLRITFDQDSVAVQNELKKIIKKYPGKTPVILYNEKTKKRSVLKPEFWICDESDAFEEFAAIIGEGNVVIR